MSKKNIKSPLIQNEVDLYKNFKNLFDEIIQQNQRKNSEVYFLKEILKFYNIDLSKIDNFTLSKIIKQTIENTSAPLNQLLEIANLSESTYHFNKDKPDYLTIHKGLLEDIQTAYNINNGNFGPNGISKFLTFNWGIKIGHKRTKHIMKLANLMYRPAKGDPYISYRKNAVFTGNRINLLKRNFKASKPLEKIVTDIKMFKSRFGKTYFQALLDLFNGEILIFRLDEDTNAIHTIEMIEGLHKIYGDKIAGATIHTDNGVQYSDKRYDEVLSKYKLVKSLSRIGNCLDNSPAESLNKAVQVEWFEIYNSIFYDIDEMRRSLSQYIYYYNNIRPKESNNWIPPYIFKKLWIEHYDKK